MAVRRDAVTDPRPSSALLDVVVRRRLAAAADLLDAYAAVPVQRCARQRDLMFSGSKVSSSRASTLRVAGLDQGSRAAVSRSVEPSTLRLAAPHSGRATKVTRIRRAETHLSYRSNWLRAAVLGANDGIVSTASLVLGVAASGASSAAIITAGIAGLAAGALSMAAGEYVSVSSQRDAEQADIRLEERGTRARSARGAPGADRDLRATRLPPSLRARSREPCRSEARSPRISATSSGWTSSGRPARCKPPGPRPRRSPSGRRCRCWRPRSRRRRHAARSSSP